MESNYTNREFEQFVKESADQYRMFPSEKVWKGINNTLHTRRKWYGLGLGLLLLVTGTAVTWVMVSYPVSKDQKVAGVPVKDISSGQSIIAPSTSTAAKPKHHNVLPFSNPTGLEDNTTASPNQESISSQDELTLQQQQLIIVPAEDQFMSIITVRPQVSTINPSRSKAVNAIADPVNMGITDVPSFVIIDEALQQQTPAASNDINITEEKTAIQQPLLYPVPNDAVAINTKKPRAISWQLFVTPTISYRKLSDNKSFDNSGPSGVPAAPKDNINDQVTHKPDMGLQLGFAARYKLTKSLKLRGGFQFNINRYDIKAVAYNPELATIELNGTNGATLATWTSYRNNRKANSYRSDWLKNFYFSISAPIGAEMIVLGKNKKTSFGIAGTIQPTYIIKDRAYVISSNYKNYANVPSLTRHVNVNTGFETFINYTNGKTKWQIGPQVRYQVLSSFNNKYPVKENLFDFGVKIGVTLND